jgi:hypothetical protein
MKIRILKMPIEGGIIVIGKKDGSGKYTYIKGDIGKIFEVSDPDPQDVRQLVDSRCIKVEGSSPAEEE